MSRAYSRTAIARYALSERNTRYTRTIRKQQGSAAYISFERRVVRAVDSGAQRAVDSSTDRTTGAPPFDQLEREAGGRRGAAGAEKGGRYGCRKSART